MQEFRASVFSLYVLVIRNRGILDSFFLFFFAGINEQLVEALKGSSKECSTKVQSAKRVELLPSLSYGRY